MIRILNPGKEKRETVYLKTTCPWCNAELVFELKDVWVDDPCCGIGRVECPVSGCRSKIHITLPVHHIMDAETVDKEVYDNAHSDTSKSGFRMLMEEKKLKDQEVITNEDNN